MFSQKEKENVLTIASPLALPPSAYKTKNDVQYPTIFTSREGSNPNLPWVYPAHCVLFMSSCHDFPLFLLTKYKKHI